VIDGGEHAAHDAGESVDDNGLSIHEVPP